ncbi:hypothetical protein ABW16_01235 [Mycolicibacter heraklionensis]|uniref:Uncharacterized protein n=2 Tax=Mycolicibacter heraklionensis TaxID=512402 RepID=A0ABR5FKM7_9MYCO|nr:hypothetical protein ABW16_01235 [Mycolicibacter heraklionensis]
MTDLMETYPGGPCVTPAERAAIKASAEQHVEARRETDRAVRHTFSRFSLGNYFDLFDPSTMPHMYERANAVMHHLHTSHDLEYVDQSPAGTAKYDPDNPSMQAAMFVHFVNRPNSVHVFRDDAALHDWFWVTAWPLDRCTMHDSAACTGDGVYTVFVPVQRGQFLLIFEACLPCAEYLCDLRLGEDILAEADARVAFDAVRTQMVERWRSIRAEQEREQ